MPHAHDSSSYHGPDIPSELGTGLATVLNLGTRPETLGDFARALARLAERKDIEVSPDVLCTTTRSPHRATFNDQTHHFQCVQDAFLVPYLVDAVDTVEITTETPVNDTQIEISAGDDGIEAAPPGAVMSFGVVADADAQVETETATVAYDEICPYGHAFTDRTEYKEWAESVDAITMVAPLEHARYFARTLGQTVKS